MYLVIQSFYGYYNGAEDYFTHERDGAYDFHDEIGIECGPNCSRIVNEAKGTYSAQLFTTRAIEIVKNHSNSTTNKPLFLYLPYQSVHGPAECPQSYIQPYEKTINNSKRYNLFLRSRSFTDFDSEIIQENLCWNVISS